MAKKSRVRPHAISCLRAIEAFIGSRELVAKKLGVSQACISNWHERKKISGNYVLPLSQMIGGKFTVEELLGAKD